MKMKKIVLVLSMSLACLGFAFASGKMDNSDEAQASRKIIFEIIKADMVFDKSFDLPFKPTIGYGSGAFHFDGDDKDIIYCITDRGINIDAKDTNKILHDDFCETGKVFPYPEFTPTVYKLKISKTGLEVLETIPLKTGTGKKISGISNPGTELSYGLDKKELTYDVNGIDSEALAISKDGMIYIADEYGPSIFVTDMQGTIKERWIPKGVAQTLKGTEYTLVENFPAKLRQRQLNRGLESVALSKDEKFVYTILQSPFADEIDSKQVPFYVIDRAAGKVLQTLTYPLDDADTFKHDSEKKVPKQNDVKISEMATLPNGDLLVLERVTKTTKFYRINVKNAKSGMLKKDLIFSTDDYENFPKKIEGIAVINDNEWILITDNDFGIEGDVTTIVRVTLH